MSIESTHTVKRCHAIEMLTEKNITVYANDCNERLADMLYENRESIFENYLVVNDDHQGYKYEKFKSYW